MPRRIRSSALALLTTALLAVSATARPEDATETESAPTLSPAVGVADRLLAETATAADAARRWLRENLSNEAVNGYARSAEDAVTEKFNCALEQARQEHAATVGLFAYAPACHSSNGPWARIAEGTPLPTRVVLLIHGLDEGGSIWDNAAPAIAHAGYAVLRFNYPNDQRIAASANALIESLRELRSRDVRTVDIVAHSMGGLVARDTLTRPEFLRSGADARADLPAVPRLIMLGTPNLGSPLAGLRQAMEVRDQFVRWMKCENKTTSGLLGFMVDGHGEAGDDLHPGSTFLTELNKRPLPENVAITIVVGEVASSGRQRITDALESSYFTRILGEERAASLRNGTASVWEEVGDGVVPASSARLQGVSDVVTVAADHRSMIRVLEPVEAARNAIGIANPTPPAIPIILDRLASPAPVPQQH
ncbi:MAG: alpha/beta hydrolase [Phycisphaerae bacterium]|nr:alpha/beta hydrolase [Phycisphaerae bacterium]